MLRVDSLPLKNTIAMKSTSEGSMAGECSKNGGASHFPQVSKDSNIRVSVGNTKLPWLLALVPGTPEP